jgi:hypothetical protein
MLFSHPIRLPWTSLRSLRPLQPKRFFSASRPRLTIEMATVDTTERLSQLRQLMRDNKVDVYSMSAGLLLSPQPFPIPRAVANPIFSCSLRG